MGGGSKEVPASSEGEEEMRGVQRRYDLDWIRIFVVLHLVPFHMLLAIRELGGGISRAVLTFPGIFASPWHMHIMFLISGAATYYALRFRSIREYALNRLKRLFVPLLFCLVVIIPVHHFYWRFPPLSPMVEESHYRNFLIFYLKDYPGLLWANGTFFLGNLWFVYYLFIFSLICLPVFVYFEGEGGRRFAIRLADILERRGMIFALGVPLAVGVAILSMIQRSRKGWDIVHDLTNSFQYISCFIYGYLISSDERVWEAVERQWKVSGVALVVLNLILLVLGSRMGRVVVAGIRGFGSWLWILLLPVFHHPSAGDTRPRLLHPGVGSSSVDTSFNGRGIDDGPDASDLRSLRQADERHQISLRVTSSPKSKLSPIGLLLSPEHLTI